MGVPNVVGQLLWIQLCILISIILSKFKVTLFADLLFFIPPTFANNVCTSTHPSVHSPTMNQSVHSTYFTQRSVSLSIHLSTHLFIQSSNHPSFHPIFQSSIHSSIITLLAFITNIHVVGVFEHQHIIFKTCLKIL